MAYIQLSTIKDLIKRVHTLTASGEVGKRVWKTPCRCKLWALFPTSVESPYVAKCHNEIENCIQRRQRYISTDIGDSKWPRTKPWLLSLKACGQSVSSCLYVVDLTGPLEAVEAPAVTRNEDLFPTDCDRGRRRLGAWYTTFDYYFLGVLH